MQTMAEFLEYFRRQRAATRKLVASIPDDHFAWAPNPGAFACGDLVRHMMQAEWFWRKLIVASARREHYDPLGLSGTASERLEAMRDRNLQAARSPKFGATAAECLERWADIQSVTETELSALPPEAFHARTVHPLAVVEGPLWEACLFMVGHEVHHRGQLSAYLKVLGVPQPASLFD
jgi:uncharacterized damage-inducible protein DinB